MILCVPCSVPPPGFYGGMTFLCHFRKEIHADIMTNKVSNLKVDELSSIEKEIARCEALLSEKGGEMEGLFLFSSEGTLQWISSMCFAANVY